MSAFCKIWNFHKMFWALRAWFLMSDFYLLATYFCYILEDLFRCQRNRLLQLPLELMVRKACKRLHIFHIIFLIQILGPASIDTFFNFSICPFLLIYVLTKKVLYRCRFTLTFLKTFFRLSCDGWQRQNGVPFFADMTYWVHDFTAKCMKITYFWLVEYTMTCEILLKLDFVSLWAF